MSLIIPNFFYLTLFNNAQSLYLLDRISEHLCLVCDVAELVLTVHPDEAVLKDAEEGQALMLQIVNQVGVSPYKIKWKIHSD